MNNRADEIIAKLIENILQPIVVLLFAIAILVFFWGIFQMIWKADDEKAVTTGKQHIMWGVVGLVIMFGALGIIEVIKGTLQIP